MTKQLLTLIAGAASGAAATAIVDLRSFSAARKLDRTVTFDWALALSNWAVGAIVGAVPGFAFTMGD